MQKKKKGPSSLQLIMIYLAVAFLGMMLLGYVFSGLIRKHDEEFTRDIDSLIAEKMNRSIEYMQQSVDEMAAVLSYQDLLELDQLYDQLVDSIDDADYVSIGIVAIDGTVYGLDSEKDELVKWDLINMAANTQDVSISEPYRSGVTGKLVFTMFAPIYQQGERLGCIFVTYPLSELEKIAGSEVMQDKVEVYLVNPFSENVIFCSGKDDYMVGNWLSTHLVKKDIDPKDIEAYEKWEENMRNGVETGAVQFVYQDEAYVMVYQQINSMNGWSVASKIPTRNLSNTMKIFGYVVAGFSITLIVLSLLLLVVLSKKDAEEKARFEYMSTHDALTDLYNRAAFEAKAQEFFDSIGKTNYGALIFMDVDFFKQINDKYGHDIGDKTLQAVANCLREQFAQEAIIARYGGDEFVILVRQVASIEALNTRLDNLKMSLKQVRVLDYEDNEFCVHYSAGIAAFPDNGNNFSDLVKYADLALYMVKEEGRDGYKWFNM